MEDFQDLLGPALSTFGKEGQTSLVELGLRHWRCARGKHRSRGHGSKVAHQRIKARIAQPHAVNVDHGHAEIGRGQQLGQGCGVDPGMASRDNASFVATGIDQGGAKDGQAIGTGDGPDQRRIRRKSSSDQSQRERQFIDGVQRPDGDA